MQYVLPIFLYLSIIRSRLQSNHICAASIGTCTHIRMHAHTFTITQRQRRCTKMGGREKRKSVSPSVLPFLTLLIPQPDNSLCDNTLRETIKIKKIKIYWRSIKKQICWLHSFFKRLLPKTNICKLKKKKSMSYWQFLKCAAWQDKVLEPKKVFLDD